MLCFAAIMASDACVVCILKPCLVFFLAYGQFWMEYSAAINILQCSFPWHISLSCSFIYYRKYGNDEEMQILHISFLKTVYMYSLCIDFEEKRARIKNASKQNLIFDFSRAEFMPGIYTFTGVLARAAAWSLVIDCCDMSTDLTL